MLNDLYHHLDPVAFSIGSFGVRWYGIAYLLAFVAAFFIIRATIRHWKLPISDDDLITFMLAAVIGVFVGGRLGYVLFYGEGFYFSHPLRILAVRDGGMSFHGGLIGVAIGCSIVCAKLKIPIRTMADLGAFGACAGFFFGRIANFVNGELWGKPTTLPWGVVFDGAGSMARHPSQLYEALLEGVLIFVVLLILARKLPPRPRGTLMGWMLVIYSISRILVEFVRVPDAQLGYLFGNVVTMGQLLSVPLLIVGIALLFYARYRPEPQLGRDGAAREVDEASA